MGVGYLSLDYGRRFNGEVRVRRLIVYGLWALGLGWLVIWGVSAMVRDTMPTGVVWAFLSMVVWWLVGGARADSPKDN
jgi:hypothetical protein